jgi:hypothetical protein
MLARAMGIYFCRNEKTLCLLRFKGKGEAACVTGSRAP